MTANVSWNGNTTRWGAAVQVIFAACEAFKTGAIWQFVL